MVFWRLRRVAIVMIFALFFVVFLLVLFPLGVSAAGCVFRADFLGLEFCFCAFFEFARSFVRPIAIIP